MKQLLTFGGITFSLLTKKDKLNTSEEKVNICPILYVFLISSFYSCAFMFVHR